jgi:translation initiation factor 2 subunit 2
MSDNELAKKTEQLSLNENAGGELGFDPKMKKKKKKTVNFDETTEASTDAIPQDDPEAMFSDKKKKKKKSKKVEEDEKADDEEGEDVEDKEEDVEDEIEDGEDVFGQEGEEEGLALDDKEGWLDSDRDYTYNELLNRFFRILHSKNPQLIGEKRRFAVPPPEMARDGPKKTIFVNFADICNRLKRSPENVIQFLYAELGTTGSVDGNSRLIIKGRFQQKQIQNILRRYIAEYVLCKTCKSPNTKLNKDNRLIFMQCESCGSTRSVTTIKGGYQATTNRRAIRRAAV